MWGLRETAIIQKSAAELWEAAAGTQTDLSGATGTSACAGRLGSQTEPSHWHGLEEHERARAELQRYTDAGFPLALL